MPPLSAPLLNRRRPIRPLPKLPKLLPQKPLLLKPLPQKPLLPRLLLLKLLLLKPLLPKLRSLIRPDRRKMRSRPYSRLKGSISTAP